jgi:replicative DNA helicase
MSEATAAIEDAWRNGDAPKGVTTGLRDLNDWLGGLQPSNVIVLAGRPGMGKTALAMLMALEAAKTACTVGVVSLEMSAPQLAQRLLSLETGIDAERLTRGKLAQEHFDRIQAAKTKLDALPLHIDDRGGLTLDQISGTAHRWKRDGLGLLIVDHLGLIAPSPALQRANKVHQIEHSTGGLKALAKSLDIPIVLLTQLNRAVETRDNKRPQLSDLRDSGSIEQDADAVLLLYRDAYYLAREEPTDQGKYAVWLAKMNEARNLAELEVAKFRHGKTGRIDLIFDGPLMRFRDRAKHHESEA